MMGRNLSVRVNSSMECSINKRNVYEALALTACRSVLFKLFESEEHSESGQPFPQALCSYNFLKNSRQMSMGKL